MSSLKLIDLHNNKFNLSTIKPTKWVAKDPRLLHADCEDSDQTGQIPKLICVFTQRTGHFVGCRAVAHIYNVCHIANIGTGGIYTMIFQKT